MPGAAFEFLAQGMTIFKHGAQRHALMRCAGIRFPVPSMCKNASHSLHITKDLLKLKSSLMPVSTVRTVRELTSLLTLPVRDMSMEFQWPFY